MGSIAGAQRTRARSLERPNVVLIVLDDIGVDKVRAYGEHDPRFLPPCTPNLDRLAAEGVLFRNVWTDPLCSPSRAQVLTGRHGFRTGIGSVIPSQADVFGLSPRRERILPEVLDGYQSAAVGKWHLASSVNDGVQHPLESGFGSYAGSLYNLLRGPVPDPDDPFLPDCTPFGRFGYYNWVKTLDVSGSHRLQQVCWSTYATSDTADDAIQSVMSMRSPWFLYVAFNAAHTPFQMPPSALQSASLCFRHHTLLTSRDPVQVADAMIEVLDLELGRMIDAIRTIDPDVFVFVIGDNGTEGRAVHGEIGSCFDPTRAKGTLFQGGIHVPLLAAGPGVVPGECDALVSSTDLFATVSELALCPAPAADSVSLVPYLFGDMTPRRDTVYAERFWPNQETPDDPATLPFSPMVHTRVIRDARYKLYRATTAGGFRAEILFDLQTDPCERAPLAVAGGQIDPSGLRGLAQPAYEALRAELIRMGVY